MSAAARGPRIVVDPPAFAVGETVELRDAASDTVGTVVAIVRPDHVRVEWNTGQGYMGKTTLLSARVLRRRPAD